MDAEDTIRRHRPLIRKLCRRWFSDREQAEDLEGIVLAVIWKNWAKFDAEKGTLCVWLGTIVRHEACNLRRQLARRPKTVELDEQIAAPDLCLEGETVDLNVLDQLPTRLMQPFLLCAVMGHTNAEAGALLKQTKGTVGKCVSAARRRLVEILR